ncbi:MAG: CarD family transcriptional regulator [Bacillota bacterium]
MFKIGDRVVYPMHGAGIIEAIEKKEILGEMREYYVMRIPNGEMRVMIPLDNVEESGLRDVIDEEKFKEVLTVLQHGDTEMSSNWNRRYRANMEKIKTGDILEVAEVVRNLYARDKEKGLSTGEKKMLDNARQILISELMLAKGMEEQKIESWLEGALA